METLDTSSTPRPAAAPTLRALRTHPRLRIGRRGRPRHRHVAFRARPARVRGHRQRPGSRRAVAALERDDDGPRRKWNDGCDRPESGRIERNGRRAQRASDCCRSSPPSQSSGTGRARARLSAERDRLRPRHTRIFDRSRRPVAHPRGHADLRRGCGLDREPAVDRLRPRPGRRRRVEDAPRLDPRRPSTACGCC
jgi:hypothetical protein